jgi:hypothetical protein
VDRPPSPRPHVTSSPHRLVTTSPVNHFYP